MKAAPLKVKAGKIAPLKPGEEERNAEIRAIENVRDNSPSLRAAYHQRFGNEISTDNAREIVSPEYAGSREARTRLSGATHKPAGTLADHLFNEALRHPDLNKPNVVVMTAGGTGAGKTAALRANPDVAENAQFIYDSNLCSKRSSVAKIEAARAAGNRVRIIFVYREPVEALTNGVLPRAMEAGRVVSLDAHARMYRDAAENFRYLVRKYSQDPKIRLEAFDNTRGAGRAVSMPVENAAAVRYSMKELHPQLQAALENEYAAGRISEPVYRATLGSSSPEASGSIPGDPGYRSPSEGGGRNARSGSRRNDV